MQNAHLFAECAYCRMRICLQNVHIAECSSVCRMCILQNAQWIYLFISSIVSCLCVDSMSNNGVLVGKLRGVVNFETFDTGFGIINEYYQQRGSISFVFFSVVKGRTGKENQKMGRPQTPNYSLPRLCCNTPKCNYQVQKERYAFMDTHRCYLPFRT